MRAIAFLLFTTVAFGQGLDLAGRTGLPAGVDLSGAWYPVPGQDAGLITASGTLVYCRGFSIRMAENTGPGKDYLACGFPERLRQCAENSKPAQSRRMCKTKLW